MLQKLYHGSRAKGLLPVLLPSKPAQEKNGRKAEWVFATHRLDQATLYAAPMPEDGSFLTTFSDENDTLALFKTGTTAQIPASFLGRVYTLSQDGFKQVKNHMREWVRDSCVDLKHAPVKEVTDFTQVMEAGVQIFCLRDGIAPEMLNPKSPSYGLPNGINRQAIATVLANPNSPLIWVNQLWGVGEDRQLKALVDKSNGMALSRPTAETMKTGKVLRP